MINLLGFQKEVCRSKPKQCEENSLFENSFHLKVSISLQCWAILIQKVFQKHLSNYVLYFKPQEPFTFISAEVQ